MHASQQSLMMLYEEPLSSILHPCLLTHSQTHLQTVCLNQRKRGHARASLTQRGFQEYIRSPLKLHAPLILQAIETHGRYAHALHGALVHKQLCSSQQLLEHVFKVSALRAFRRCLVNRLEYLP